ncbi:hypothetical protein EVAR_75365_1 [Eumeta japonica]|uniref:Uncharacterized protein n=1 Tax=Eumeta variegata TaxID=151549 RepID=A0A4C1Y9R4_EUMVA|nr:hypothetical protein EVAR_75365_1 [Eumeta japonica]
MRNGSGAQPAATHTPLGRVLHGTRTRSLERRVHNVRHAAENNIEEIVRTYFHIDSLSNQPRQPRCDTEKRVLKILKENTTERPSGGCKTREIRIPRCHSHLSRAVDRELHTFVDARERANAAAVYWRIKANRRFFWTDPKTILARLRSGLRFFKQFVAHRVVEIEEETAVNEWRWTPSSHNVADDTTRDVPRDFN